MITLDEQIKQLDARRHAVCEQGADPQERAHQFYRLLCEAIATLRSVKQAEPVACSHEPYQGRCVHCDVEYKNGRPIYAAPAAPQSLKFAETYCSQCGGEFGPGDHGYSHCSDHAAPGSRDVQFLPGGGPFPVRVVGSVSAPQSGWVSVEERLPTDTKTVLTNSNAEGIKLGMYCEGYWWSGNEEFPMTEVTHWMPLPAAPGREG